MKRVSDEQLWITQETRRRHYDVHIGARANLPKDSGTPGRRRCQKKFLSQLLSMLRLAASQVSSQYKERSAGVISDLVLGLSDKWTYLPLKTNPWKLLVTYPLKIVGWMISFPFKMVRFQGTRSFIFRRVISSPKQQFVARTGVRYAMPAILHTFGHHASVELSKMLKIFSLCMSCHPPTSPTLQFQISTKSKHAREKSHEESWKYSSTPLKIDNVATATTNTILIPGLTKKHYIQL